jgi:hypothetical protein
LIVGGHSHEVREFTKEAQSSDGSPKHFQEFEFGLRVAIPSDVVSKRTTQLNQPYHARSKDMSTYVDVTKQVVHDKFESQIKTAEAKLDTLKAKAEASKANVEIKAITALLPKKQAILRKLEELKKSGGDRWEQAKADLEGRLADFEKSVKGIESKTS